MTGNTVIDALLYTLNRLERDVARQSRVQAHIAASGSAPGARRLILVTGQRRENFGDGFDRIFTALRSLAQRFGDIDFVYHVYLNHRVREPAHALLSASVTFI